MFPFKVRLLSYAALMIFIIACGKQEAPIPQAKALPSAGAEPHQVPRIKGKGVPERTSPVPPPPKPREVPDVSEKTRFPAEPLPKGVIFGGNLSAALAAIVREEQATTLWLAFRCIDRSQPWTYMDCKLVLTDDRENNYRSERVTLEGGNFIIPNNLPNGFTWITSRINVTMPRQAPITKIEINVRAGGVRGFDRWEEIDFRSPTIPSLGFAADPGEIIRRQEYITLDKHLSIRLEGMTAQADLLSGEKCLKYKIAFGVRNADYSRRELPLRDFGVYALHDNGRLSYNGGLRRNEKYEPGDMMPPPGEGPPISWPMESEEFVPPSTTQTYTGRLPIPLGHLFVVRMTSCQYL